MMYTDTRSGAHTCNLIKHSDTSSLSAERSHYMHHVGARTPNYQKPSKEKMQLAPTVH